MVAPEPESDSKIGAGMTCFLEASIVRETLEGWTASADEKPTIAATCRRLIEYATYCA